MRNAEKGQSAKMGLFEDIERAWFTIDKKLFLWDYSDGWVLRVDSTPPRGADNTQARLQPIRRAE